MFLFLPVSVSYLNGWQQSSSFILVGVDRETDYVAKKILLIMFDKTHNLFNSFFSYTFLSTIFLLIKMDFYVKGNIAQWWLK